MPSTWHGGLRVTFEKTLAARNAGSKVIICEEDKVTRNAPTIRAILRSVGKGRVVADHYGKAKVDENFDARFGSFCKCVEDVERNGSVLRASSDSAKIIGIELSDQ